MKVEIVEYRLWINGRVHVGKRIRTRSYAQLSVHHPVAQVVRCKPIYREEGLPVRFMQHHRKITSDSCSGFTGVRGERQSPGSHWTLAAGQSGQPGIREPGGPQGLGCIQGSHQGCAETEQT